MKWNLLELKYQYTLTWGHWFWCRDGRKATDIYVLRTLVSITHYNLII